MDMGDLRGVTTVMDATGETRSVDWLGLDQPDRAVLYVTDHDTGQTETLTFTDPLARRAVRAILAAIRPEHPVLAGD